MYVSVHGDLVEHDEHDSVLDEVPRTSQSSYPIIAEDAVNLQGNGLLQHVKSPDLTFHELHVIFMSSSST